jgi:hypothetical protein
MTDLLTPAHRSMLEIESGIASAVIAERGYRSLTAREAAATLPGLGFSMKVSQLGSGLLFPLTVPDDPVPLSQFRPDRPRRDDDGKLIKYEIPHKASQRLILHLRALAALREGTGPVYVTEGAKKVDALVSAGATALGVIGVQSFAVKRTAAEKKRGAPKVLLPDWQHVMLQGRHVILAYDSDAASNNDVAQAEQDLAGLLRKHGAQVSRVRLPAKANGTKQGIDDFLADQHSLTDVVALVEPMPRLRFETISAPTLADKTQPPVRYVIPGKLPAGATLFVGRGKDGKSLMVWNIALATATGGKALGAYDVEQGDVLYLALEDGERRGQQRLFDQMDHFGMKEAPPRLDLVFWTAPRIGEGFMERLETWVDEHPEARLVIVDILEKVRPARTRDGVYVDDYRALEALQQFGQRYNIAVLVVHHSNKTKPDDFRDTANGSMGLIGACDTFWSLQRMAGATEATLKMLGRDIAPQDLALQFLDGFWSVLGDTATVQMRDERKALVEVLRLSPAPLTPVQIAEKLQKNINTTRVLLRKLVMAGVIMQPQYGLYTLSSPYPSVNSINAVNVVNSVNSVNSWCNGEEKQGVMENSPGSDPGGDDPTEGEEFTKNLRQSPRIYGEGVPVNSFQPIDNAGSYGDRIYEFTEFTLSTHNGATDCYPPPCPHTETRTEPMPDGSSLVRCVACRRPVSTTNKERD